MIPASELRRMRHDALATMEHRAAAGAGAVIMRPTSTATETGNRLDYAQVGPAVDAGLRDPNPGPETIIAGRITSGTIVTVVFPALTDIQAQDRILIAGQTLEVEGVVGSLSSYEVNRRAVCRVIL